MNKPIRTAAAFLLAFGTVATLRTAAVLAADMPQMKEGLWKIHMVTTSQPGNKSVDATETLCRSHAYDEYAHQQNIKRTGCTPFTENVASGVWTMEGDCTVRTSVMHIKATIKSIDADHVHSETHSTITPPMMGITDSTIVQDQTFAGACPAGVEPGDMTMGNGMVMHLWKH